MFFPIKVDQVAYNEPLGWLQLLKPSQQFRRNRHVLHLIRRNRRLLLLCFRRGDEGQVDGIVHVVDERLHLRPLVVFTTTLE